MSDNRKNMTSVESILKKYVPSKLKQELRERYLSMNVAHIYGPKSVQLSKDQAAVTCVLRNAEYYIRSFIEHYLNMGFCHIFFLDNGSTDKTIPIAKSYEQVSICRCVLPIGSNQRLFKKYLAKKSIRGGWCLDADADEFFDFPLSDGVGLRGLLAYLNQHQYTAVITQLLDMFSDKPLSYLIGERHDDIKLSYKYYDLSDITKTDYRT